MATILHHHTSYSYENEAGDTIEVPVMARYISCPAEPDVGIMYPYIEWIGVYYPNGDKGKHPAPTTADYDLWAEELDSIDYRD